MPIIEKSERLLTTAEFAKRAFIVFAIGGAFLAAWQIAPLLLIGFGGVILAVLVRSGARVIARYLPIPTRWASLLVIATLVALVALSWRLTGGELVEQFQELSKRLPGALDQARQWLESNQLTADIGSPGDFLDSGSLATSVLAAATMTAEVLFDIGIILLVALYLCINPGLYVRGSVRLIPAHLRHEVRSALDTAEQALHSWLLGQLIAMAAVGALTGLGLWALDIPLAFILALVAAILEFVPIIGPFIAAVPAVLIGFTQSPTDALYVAILYFGVQQLEGAIIMPMAQRWAVHLPPLLGLLSIAVFGVLFGIRGMLFATPLTVIAMVLVNRFYVEPIADIR